MDSEARRIREVLTNWWMKGIAKSGRASSATAPMAKVKISSPVIVAIPAERVERRPAENSAVRAYPKTQTRMGPDLPARAARSRTATYLRNTPSFSIEHLGRGSLGPLSRAVSG
jgi:hypothetical protein